MQVKRDMENDVMMQKLREIILQDDREEIKTLRKILDDKILLQERIDPIIEEHLDLLRQNFPESYQRVVNKQIEAKINSSREELLAVLYPAMGRMIKKYVSYQFQLLRESIELQLKKAARKGIIGWFRKTVLGVRESEWVLNAVAGPSIEDIFVIEKESGILLGSATVHSKVDLDLLAGMLTAIKAFAEDAFLRGEQDLEMIEYDSFKILLHSFHKFYMALVITGALTASDREKLAADVIDFSEKELRNCLQKPDNSTNLLVKQKLERFFLNPQIVKTKQGK